MKPQPPSSPADGQDSSPHKTLCKRCQRLTAAYIVDKRRGWRLCLDCAKVLNNKHSTHAPHRASKHTA